MMPKGVEHNEEIDSKDIRATGEDSNDAERR